MANQLTHPTTRCPDCKLPVRFGELDEHKKTCAGPEKPKRRSSRDESHDRKPPKAKEES